MTTSTTRSGLRGYIRTADDSAYVEAAAAETPRSRIVDLYGPLAQARSKAPVHNRKQAELIGAEDYRKQEAFQVPFSCALSYETCQEALNDERLSSRFWQDTIGHVWGTTIIGMDGTEHRRHRSLITQAFTRKSLARWQQMAIQPAVHGLIDRFERKGTADLFRDFTLLFPVYIITEMMGLPYEDIQRFNTWAGETIAVFYDPARAMAASRNLEDYLSPLIEQRRGGDGEDLITLLANAELDGSRLETIEIVSFLRLLLPAGGETTARSTASMLLGLLQNQDQLDAVVADRDLLPQAIEEGLRWEPPLMSINRIALEDLELGGVAIEQGSVLEVSLGAANRDPARWVDPDTFNIFRDKKPHIAFAWGAHACLGTHLARAEMLAAITALLDRLPGLRLDPESGHEARVQGIGLRSPNKVPVVFDSVTE
ncbi:cytochrome P450 226B1 Cyp226B1 [Mycolicibacter sinensis]|uniref:Cytochrome P450 226B1 Cyp226B1 n=1 Tax=Mycolicibacter sinensis (strain JDM601) TaxID=875328 RepID=F5YRL3_MYCSD|nr:cytochrome P450 [Mycolicibacter sinensis]AEF37804.1 cytochrome P450 226B1 Cyp226B1 [Mycolicibacter sinensis]